jgi:pyruvate-ferredoxin/flavodoxin oxidoreductase
MACIDVCPDTALPNTAQSVDTILQKIFSGYISDESDRSTLVAMVPKMSSSVRDGMNQALEHNTVAVFDTLLFKELQNTGLKEKTLTEIKTIVKDLPLGYGKAKTIFQMAEKKNKGDGGLFSIFVSDLCKGCGECVDACGDHMALKMVEEDVELRGKHLTASSFLKTLPSTPKKYLGLFNPDNVEESRTAVLHNHLMIQENYNSFTAGDGACAGCGEKSVLRGIVTMTEALMRPLWDHKVERISGLAKAMEIKLKKKAKNLMRVFE